MIWSKPQRRSGGDRKRGALLALFAVSLLLALRPAAAKPEVIPLAGGAKLIVSSEPDSPLVAFDIFFRVGYAEETNDKAAAPGITALISRAWASSAEGRSEAQIGTDIGRLGGNVGSTFGGDFIELYAVVPSDPETVGRAAQLLIQNIIGRPEFSPQAVADAKKDQIRAIRLEDDPLFASTVGQIRSRLWDASPYARSPLGSIETIGAITDTQVRAYYRRYFRPDRAIFVVAGNITTSEAKRLVETTMGASGWSAGPKSPPVRPIAPESLPRPVPAVRVNRQAQATLFMAGFVTPGTQSAADYPVLLLLDALAGAGKSSRLFRTLRDTRGIGYYVGSLLQPGLYQGLLAGYVATASPYRMTPAGPRPILSAVSTSLIAEMRSLITRPPDAAELDRAKALLRGRYALRHQRLKERAFLLGWCEVMGLGAAFDTDFDARINAVTGADIERLARRVLDAHHVLAVTLPPQ